NEFTFDVIYEQIEVQTILGRLGLRHPLRGQGESVAAQGDVAVGDSSPHCGRAAACQKSTSRSKSQQSRVNSTSTPTLCVTRAVSENACRVVSAPAEFRESNLGRAPRVVQRSRASVCAA